MDQEVETTEVAAVDRHIGPHQAPPVLLHDSSVQHDTLEDELTHKVKISEPGKVGAQSGPTSYSEVDPVLEEESESPCSIRTCDLDDGKLQRPPPAQLWVSRQRGADEDVSLTPVPLRRVPSHVKSGQASSTPLVDLETPADQPAHDFKNASHADKKSISADLIAPKECCVCFSTTELVGFSPCGHTNCCAACVVGLYQNFSRPGTCEVNNCLDEQGHIHCPYCRHEVRELDWSRTHRCEPEQHDSSHQALRGDAEAFLKEIIKLGRGAKLSKAAQAALRTLKMPPPIPSSSDDDDEYWETVSAEVSSRFLHAWEQASCGNIEPMGSLVADCPFTMNKTDEHGDTFLIKFARAGPSFIAPALLSSPSVRVNHANAVGDTALICAAGQGRKAFVEALLSREDIALDHVNRDGHTALSAAEAGGWTDVARLLRDVISRQHGTDAASSPIV